MPAVEAARGEPTARIGADPLAAPPVVFQNVQINGLQVAGEASQIDGAKDAAKRRATGPGAIAPGVEEPQGAAARQKARRLVRAAADIAPVGHTQNGIGRAVTAADAIGPRRQPLQVRHLRVLQASQSHPILSGRCFGLAQSRPRRPRARLHRHSRPRRERRPRRGRNKTGIRADASRGPGDFR
jgi:hypothetical protein